MQKKSRSPNFMDFLKKLGPTRRLSNIYKTTPSQLALKKKNFIITGATGKQKSIPKRFTAVSFFSQKDVYHVGTLQPKPLYMLPFTIEEMQEKAE